MKKNNNKGFVPLVTSFEGLPFSNHSYIKMFAVITGSLKKQKALLNFTEALLEMHFKFKYEGKTVAPKVWHKKINQGLRSVFKNHLSEEIDWDFRHMSTEVIDKFSTLINNPTSLYRWVIKQYNLQDVRHENLTVTQYNVDNVVKSWETN